jgi:hypothetical protein
MSAAGKRRRLPPSRAVLAYIGLSGLRSVAQEHGRERVASAAAEVGAYLWPRLNDPTAADTIPEQVFHPFRRALAEWPGDVDRARAALAMAVQRMEPHLSEAARVILAAPEMPRGVVRDAASIVARLHDAVKWWALVQFEPRELATMGALAWAEWLLPRSDSGTVEGACGRVMVALAVNGIARTDEEDVAALHHLHVGLSMLAKAVPPDLWPSFAAGGEHDTAPVAEAGHA